MNDNDKKIIEFKKQEMFRIAFVLGSIMVIILEVLALFNVVDMLWGLGLFALMYILKKIFLK